MCERCGNFTYDNWNCNHCGYNNKETINILGPSSYYYYKIEIKGEEKPRKINLMGDWHDYTSEYIDQMYKFYIKYKEHLKPKDEAWVTLKELLEEIDKPQYERDFDPLHFSDYYTRNMNATVPFQDLLADQKIAMVLSNDPIPNYIPITTLILYLSDQHCWDIYVECDLGTKPSYPKYSMLRPIPIMCSYLHFCGKTKLITGDIVNLQEYPSLCPMRFHQIDVREYIDQSYNLTLARTITKQEQEALKKINQTVKDKYHSDLSDYIRFYIYDIAKHGGEPGDDQKRRNIKNYNFILGEHTKHFKNLFYLMQKQLDRSIFKKNIKKFANTVNDVYRDYKPWNDTSRYNVTNSNRFNEDIQNAFINLYALFRLFRERWDLSDNVKKMRRRNCKETDRPYNNIVYMGIRHINFIKLFIEKYFEEDIKDTEIIKETNPRKKDVKCKRSNFDV